jgi:Protein of unknown function (DUF3606)
MADDRDHPAAHEEELLSLEAQYELWDWARTAGVSEEELRKALQPARRNP